jgi:protoporphyrinogen oxidase
VRLSKLEKLLSQTPGLQLVGNYLRGPSIGACVEQALSTAQAF